MSELIELIKNSCGTGAILSVVYSGGSRHGLARDLIVVKIVDDGFFAHEGESMAKKYLFSRVESVRDSDGVDMGYHAPPKPPEMDFATECARMKIEFEPLGWVVHYDVNDPLYFGVGRVGKRGKPLKHPVITIAFSDESESLEYDLTANDFVMTTKKLSNPWWVHGEGDGRRFKHLEKAIQFFESLVLKSKPTP